MLLLEKQSSSGETQGLSIDYPVYLLINKVLH